MSGLDVVFGQALLGHFRSHGCAHALVQERFVAFGGAAFRVGGLLRIPGPGFISTEVYRMVEVVGYAHAGGGGAATGAQQQHEARGYQWQPDEPVNG